jgi:hypothetical protein
MEWPARSVSATLSRRRPALPCPSRIGLAALLMVALFGPADVDAVSGAGAVPSTLLLHAEIPQALAFAADTARQRGWSILHSGPASVTFEQAVDTDGADASARLRIEATFSESPAGVTVALRAQEIQSSPDGATEVRDVTQHYRENLLNALDSLASKWGLRPGAAGMVPPATTDPAPPPAPASMPPDVPAQDVPVPTVTPGPTVRTSIPMPSAPAGRTTRRVGAWAYYAERYAEGIGCPPGDLGAVLEGSRDGAELHRVHCADGRQLLVRCRAGVCAESH